MQEFYQDSDSARFPNKVGSAYYAMASGAIIDLDNFTANSFNLDDIAHHLAKIQRYNGSLPINTTFSVAEHCINIHRYIRNNWFHIGLCKMSDMYYMMQLALLHDASEAILADLPSHVKRCLPEYKVLESKIQNVIYHKYIPNFCGDKLLNRYDKDILLNEVEAIMPHKLELFKKYNPTITSLKHLCVIQYNGKPSEVKEEYLKLCKTVGIKEG